MISVLLSKMEYGFPLIKDELMKMINKDMKVVVLPWAFPLELDYDKFEGEYFKRGNKKYNKYINPFIDIGIDIRNIIILNCYDYDNIDKFKNIIRDSDILMLPGGNPEMLFSKVVHDTELLYEIKKYKGIIIGESAGACLQFKRYFITRKNNYYKYFAFYDGFGCLNDSFYIDVHTVNNYKYIESLRKVANKSKKEIYAIYDNGAIIYNNMNNKIDIYGNVLKIDK